MEHEKIEQAFRAAEKYAKVVRPLKPEGMKLFLQDLKELEEKIKEDITLKALDAIQDARFDDKCKMKPALVFRKILKSLKLSHFWAD